MTNDVEFLASRLGWVFRRSGGQGADTREFDDLDALAQKQLRDGVELRAQEIPVVGSYLEANDWFLITTERVLWRAPNAEGNVEFGDLLDCTVELQRTSRVERPKCAH